VVVPDAIVSLLISCTEDVFERMVFMPVAPGIASRPVSAGPGGQVVATVAFAGPRNGFVSFHSSLECANDVASAMLGVSAHELNGEMPDAIGEVVNMIAGSLRTRMAEIEPAWTIACPSVTVGSSFETVYPHDVSEKRVPFVLGAHTIEVEVVLRNS
jgi:chemotaxis protein CheX